MAKRASDILSPPQPRVTVLCESLRETLLLETVEEVPNPHKRCLLNGLLFFASWPLQQIANLVFNEIVTINNID